MSGFAPAVQPVDGFGNPILSADRGQYPAPYDPPDARDGWHWDGFYWSHPDDAGVELPAQAPDFTTAAPDDTIPGETVESPDRPARMPAPTRGGVKLLAAVGVLGLLGLLARALKS